VQLAYAVASKHGARFSVAMNDKALLKQLSPTGVWRVSSFEVTRVDTGELLYSKMKTGVHFVDKPDQLAAFVEKLGSSS